MVMEVEEAPVADASGDAARPVDQDGRQCHGPELAPPRFRFRGPPRRPHRCPHRRKRGSSRTRFRRPRPLNPRWTGPDPRRPRALNVAPEPPAEAPAEMAEAPAPVKKTPAAKKPAAKQYIGRVMGLDFSSNYSSLTMTILTDRPVEEVTWFPVKNPRKIAIDLRGAWRPGHQAPAPVRRGHCGKGHCGRAPGPAAARAVAEERRGEGHCRAQDREEPRRGGRHRDGLTTIGLIRELSLYCNNRDTTA